MDRLVSNFVIAMALTVLETWERTRAAEKSRAIFNHPILHEDALNAVEVLKLLDERHYAQQMFGVPHGEVWLPIAETELA